MPTKKKAIKIVATGVLVAAITTTASVPFVSAGWVDNWLSNATHSSGGSYKTQQRGFLMGGNYSLHTPSKTDSFVTAKAPSFSAGCGGIDFFAGSLSFMTPDQLVAKLQRIMQNASGVVFEMAFETLCSKCVQVMNSMESLANQLNSMSMNDCQAAKGLVTGIKSEYQSMADAYATNAAAAGTEANAFDSGWAGFKGAIQKGGTDGDSMLSNAKTAAMNKVNSWAGSFKGANTEVSALYSGCTGDIKKVLPDANGVKSVIEVATINVGLLGDERALLRGLLGDILVRDDDGVMKADYMEGCADNVGKSYLSTGDVYTADFTENLGMGGCSATAVRTSVASTVSSRMRSLATALMTPMGAAISEDDLKFMGSLPMPVIQALKMSVAVGASDDMIANLSGIVADLQLLQALRGASTQVMSIVAESEKAAQSAEGLDSATCKVDAFGKSFTDGLPKFRAAAAKMTDDINRDLEFEMAGFERSFNMANHINQINNMVSTYASNTFGTSVAERAMAKARMK